jgi:hypothetical protein
VGDNQPVLELTTFSALLPLVMAIAVSKDESFIISVAADRQVVRYEMKREEAEPKSVVSNCAGHACVTIREDGQVIAVGGWDGW